MKRFLVLLMILIVPTFCITGCKTVDDGLTPPALQPIKFDKTEPFKLDVEKLSIPDSPIKMYGKINDKGNIDIIQESENADLVIFTPEEYSKFAALGKLTLTYKDLAKQEELLINTYIDKVNMLKEYTEIERYKTMEYREMWNDAQIQYKNEVKQRHKDNILHKITLGGVCVVFIGIIAAVL